MTTQSQIVPIAEEHIEGFHKVLDEVAREKRYLAMVEAPPLEEVRKYVQGNIASGVPHFVALAGAELVGWCDVAPKPRATLKHSAVLGMGIVRSYRGRGIGAGLLEATLRAANEKGFTRVELMVRVDNESAKKLYDKFGFVVEGVCRRYTRVDGDYKDGYLMALLP